MEQTLKTMKLENGPVQDENRVRKTGLVLSFFAMAVTGIFFSSCGKAASQILVDGSSTVYPITEAIAESYRNSGQKVNVTVGISGTGGGMKKFCNNETDISDASRPIKAIEEKVCSANGVKFVEMPVAYDGLAVVVNKSNDFVNSLTVDQLKKIFQYKNPAKTWKDVNPDWPARDIRAFTPGQDSGTYDYFVEVIIGKDGRVRGDATFSEDDNVLVTGINGSPDGIGFFGLAYYEENQDKLKIIPVVHPKTGKAIIPSTDTVQSGEYFPLSRPLFIYVKTTAAERPEVAAFVDYYLANVQMLCKDVGYVALPSSIYEAGKKRFASRTAGSLMMNHQDDHVRLDSIFK